MIFTYSMLLHAWKDTVVQASEEPNRARYRYYLEEKLISLLESLENGRYYPAPYREKIVKYPKVRVVQVPSIDDKIVQHAICDNYAYERMTKPIIKEASACMVGRGDGYAMRLLMDQLRSYYTLYGSRPYFIKGDIHQFFASIPHDRLFDLLDRYIEDFDVNWLMKRFVLNTGGDRGMALGYQQSQPLANLYLSILDHFVKEKLGARYYGRYMDDFYIISEDKAYLEDCLQQIDELVQSIGLELNPKTKIVRDRLTFLGFTYGISDSGRIIRRLAQSKRITKRRQLKKMLSQIDSGELSAEGFVNSYAGWRAHALRGKCKSLVRDWDEWIRSELLARGYELHIHKYQVSVTPTGKD